MLQQRAKFKLMILFSFLIFRSASLNINSVQNSLNTRHSAVYTISTVNSSRKRNIEELKEIEVQNNGN